MPTGTIAYLTLLCTTKTCTVEPTSVAPRSSYRHPLVQNLFLPASIATSVLPRPETSTILAALEWQSQTVQLQDVTQSEDTGVK